MKVQRLLGHSTVVFLIKGLGALAGFIIQILTARWLEPKSFGLYEYTLSLLGVLVVVTTFGFDKASVKYVSAYDQKSNYRRNKYISQSLQIVTINSLVVQILIFTYIYVSYKGLSEETASFLILAILVPSRALLQVNGSVLVGLKKIIKAKICTDLMRRVILLLGVWGLWAYSIEAKSYDILLIYFVGTIIPLWIAWREQKHENIVVSVTSISDVELDWVFTAGRLFLVSGFALILFKVDTIIVGNVISLKKAGVYAVGSKLSTALVFLLTAVNAVVAPEISRAHESGNTTEIQQYYSYGSLISVAGLSIVYLFMILFADNIINMYGMNYTSAYGILVILGIGQVFNAIVGPSGVIVNMSGIEEYAIYILSGGAALNISLNYVLCVLFGIKGAALATTITIALTNTAFTIIIWHKLDITPYGYWA